MGVRIQMISVVVPKKLINSCTEPGWFGEYWDKYGHSDFKWHDEHLLVSVHPAPEFVGWEIDFWEKQGLISVESETWKDMCVVDQTGGPTLPCDWLEWDRKNTYVWLKGTSRGEIAGPADPSGAGRAVHLPIEELIKANTRVVQDRPWWKFWGRLLR